MEIYTSMIARALKRNEFELYYQPQVSIQTEKITGLEALIRWNHPEFGTLSPYEFIPQAEKSGMILKLDEWVIENALRQNMIWQAMGLDKIPVAVNVSARYIQQKDIGSFISDRLKDACLSSEYIELEITERVKIENIERAISNLDKLKSLGIRIAIDDFGTEYSSFSYLRELPVNTVKIDKSFVDGIGISLVDEAIIKTVILLLNSLNISIIAEGVETKMQRDFLLALGCGIIQGYYYYKPMSAREIERTFLKAECVNL